jgi:hypothetical protein
MTFTVEKSLSLIRQLAVASQPFGLWQSWVNRQIHNGPRKRLFALFIGSHCFNLKPSPAYQFIMQASIAVVFRGGLPLRR